MLGVGTYGQLNVPGGVASPTGETRVGLRYMPTGNESTSHGCECEGWGVGIATAGGSRVASGSANNDFGGITRLLPVSFTSTASTATSVVELLDDTRADSLLRITHAFTPATETPLLYRVSVSIENISGVVVEDLRYTRTFDWDIEPDTFNEFVTHAGVAATPAVLYANNNGFESSDPFASRFPILPEGVGDFVNLGPTDHGSNFDFGFGTLGIGEIFNFDIFYGAGGTEASLQNALGLVQAEVASFGKAASDPDGLGVFNSAGLETNTFVFGFSGVGGQIIFPDPSTPNPIPLPASIWLLGGAIGLLGARRAVKARKTV